MIQGIHIVKRIIKGGKPRWYVYAWRGGPQIRVWTAHKPPLLTQADLKAVVAAQEKRHAAVVKPQANILQTLIRTWRSSNPARPSSLEWERLAPGTKKTWGAALDVIEEKWGKTPLELWNDPRMTVKVVEWRNSRAATPRSADIGVMVLKALLKFGRLRGSVSLNAAEGVPSLYRNGQRAEIIWTDEDMAHFATAADQLNRSHVNDGLRLAALTGLRRADLVSLIWAEVGKFAIEKLALKRSAGRRRRVTMPRIPALNALLEELKTRSRAAGVETVLVNSAGQPWSADGFGGSFNRVRDEAGIVFVDEDTGKPIKKHLHDVRGTFCTRLLTEGRLTDLEAAEVMGWAPERVALIRRVYVDQARVVIALGEKLHALG